MARRNEIPSRDAEISALVSIAQVRMFELAKKRGFTAKVLHLETGISTSTLGGWIAGTSMMPLDGFVKLAAIEDFPNELLSLPFEAAKRSISDAEPDETDVDDAAIAALEYALEWARARHPASPSGTRIDHTEKPNVAQAGRHLADRAGKVGGA
ncbi:hypothetical protein HRJ34_15460 [Rhizorhabdus wittichii]|uniref:Uncharacterized protein n=1 Tax=Rhizorhabdus wittichii TaxID=160791 RepID=A0A975D124_9SPHN|nr:hypothetical protein [Rhizorhabdus wittichii]QTH19765.1 hypothetical protein HRJ34_15460 [Rhizorhabdus wittichii]